MNDGSARQGAPANFREPTVSPTSGGHEYVWTEIRDRAIVAFGNQAPGAALEADVIEVFEHAPALVVGTIKAVAEDFRAGRCRSPWPVLRTRLTSTAPATDLVVTDESERERAIARAEQLLRAIGPHLDREAEVIAELFVEPGERSGPVLGRWADDAELRERMLTFWRSQRQKAAA